MKELTDEEWQQEHSRAEIESVHPYKDPVVRRGESEMRKRAANGCTKSMLGYYCQCNMGYECN